MLPKEHIGMHNSIPFCGIASPNSLNGIPYINPAYREDICNPIA